MNFMKHQAEVLGEELWRRYTWGATNKYLEQTEEGKFITLNYKKDGSGSTEHPLLPFMLSQHVMQQKTYGVFSGNKSACFICFDIDSVTSGSIQSQPRETFMMAESIIEALASLGIPEHSIATSWSGLKGFHVEVYFDVPTALWLHEKLYWLTLVRAGLAHMHHRIEPRPLPGMGVKLPLGRNFKNPQVNNSICSFVNPYEGFTVIEDLNYIMSVPRVASGKIYEIWKMNEWDFWKRDDVAFFLKDKSLSKVAPEIPVAKSVIVPALPNSATLEQDSAADAKKHSIPPPVRPSATELLANGLAGPGNRVNAFIALTIYYKMEVCLCKEEALTQITDWFSRQKQGVDYTTDYEQSIKELRKIVGTIYSYGTPSSDTVQLSAEDLRMALKLPKTSSQLVFLALLIHARRFKRTDFYMTYDQWEEITGLSRKSVADAKKELLAAGYLSEIPTLPEARRGYKTPCCYRLLEIPADSNSKRVEVASGSKMTKDDLRMLQRQLCA